MHLKLREYVGAATSRVLGLHWHHGFIGEKSNELSDRGSHNGLSPHSLGVLRLDSFKCLLLLSHELTTQWSWDPNTSPAAPRNGPIPIV